MNEYTIRVRLSNGMITEVRIQALSYGIAKAQAETYGTVLGLIESRSLNRAWS